MNPANNRGPPPSFKTNVNRAKTKRWVEAKSYSYDGDDWGEADDFDEYDGYDAPEPEPAHPASIKQGGPPGPAPPRIQDPAGRGRNNSFGPNDEQRAFSGPQPMHTAYAQYQQPSAGAALPRPQQGHPAQQGPPPQGYPQYPQNPQQHRRPSVDSQGKPPPGPSIYVGHPPRGSNGSRAQSMTSQGSQGDQYQRAFSHASAAPPALQTSRPPRKSSLSQQDGTTPVEGPDRVVSPMTDVSEGAAASQRRERSASGSAPVFVRPADIYRRMHEEKERERLSQESSRPSLDAINNSRDESPAKSGDEGHKRQPALEPVAERRSEYGMEGLLKKQPVEQHPPPRKPTGSPMLPDLQGIGTDFGDDFGSSFMDSKDKAPAAAALPPTRAKAPEQQSQSSGPASTGPPTRSDTTSTITATMSPTDDGNLQHQPSMGFTSAVHSAFDQPIRQKSSATDSVGRSNSDSTNAISPIMTRPQSASDNFEHPPTIPEEPVSSAQRRVSGDTITNAKPFAQETRRSSGASIPSFIPGHRRDMNTPSPDNSPARTPILEQNKQLRNPQEVELDLTTPATTEFSGKSDDEAPATTPTAVRNSAGVPAVVTLSRAQTGAGTGSSTPRSRSESPTKGRVRDLADKFETTSSQGSSSRPSSPVKDSLKPRQESPARNDSFRPNMPGGWVSYAPSASSQQPEADASRTGSNVSRPVQGLDASRTGSSVPQFVQGSDAYRNESSISKAVQDPFAAAAAAGSALAGAIATTVGVGQQADSDSESVTRNAARPRTRNSKIDTTFHPEAQRLRAPLEDVGSSVEPTPLETGTRGEDGPEYFAPIPPLKQKGVRLASGKPLPPLSHTSPTDTLSVDNSPNDQESDRLRKELVRELSPQSEAFPKDPVHSGSGPIDPRASTVTQESSALPSAYDSYWNGSPQASQHPPDGKSASPHVSSPQAHDAFKSAEPLAATKPSEASTGTGQVMDSSKPVLQQRFSWEAPLQEADAGAPASPPRNTAGAVTRDPHPTAASSSVGAPLAEMGVDSSFVEPDTQRPTADAGTSKALPQAPIPINHEDTYPTSAHPRESRTSLPAAPSDHAPSLEALSPSTTREGALGGPLPPAPFLSQPKVPAFREIVAMRSPIERIEKFNTAREQVAKEETGLDQWVLYMTEHVEEHAGAMTAGGAASGTAHFAGGLNAASSSPAAATPFGTPGSAAGPSPASGKPKPASGTTKAKEIFSSGGMLVSKSKAKDLFSKGRSKFRKSGSDKVEVEYTGGTFIFVIVLDTASWRINGVTATWPPMVLTQATPTQSPTPAAAPSATTSPKRNPPRSLSTSSIPKVNAVHSMSNASTPKATAARSSVSDMPLPESLPSLSPVSIRKSNAPSLEALGRIPSMPSPGPDHPSEPPLPNPPAQSNDSQISAPTSSPPRPNVKTWYPPRPSRQSAASDADSPTLGLGDPVHFRTISQVSQGASAGGATEQQSRLDVLARLTVHQNEMGSFGASFPPDLVAPAMPAIPAEYATGKGPSAASGLLDGVGSSNLVGARPDGFPPRTVSRKRVLPDLRGQQLAAQKSKLQLDPAGSDLRPFSFITFDEVPSDRFAIRAPVTPKASNFELNKAHGQGLRPSRSGASRPALPPKDDAAGSSDAITPLPPTAASGRRKPGSVSRSRETSTSREQRQISDANTEWPRANSSAQLRTLDERDSKRMTPHPRAAKGRHRSQHSSDMLNRTDESPGTRKSPGSGGKARPPGTGGSPPSARLRHRSLLKGLGIATTPEKRMSEQQTSPQQGGVDELAENRRPEAAPSQEAGPKPVKSRSMALHTRSVSAALPPRSSTSANAQAQGKARRFSGLGSIFGKPKAGPRKSSFIKPAFESSPREEALLQEREEQQPERAASPPATQHKQGGPKQPSPSPPRDAHRGPQLRLFPPRHDSHGPQATTMRQPRHSPHASDPQAAPSAQQRQTTAPSNEPPSFADTHPAFRPRPEDAATSTVIPSSQPPRVDTSDDDDVPPPPPPKDDKPPHTRKRSGPSSQAGAPPRSPSSASPPQASPPPNAQAERRRPQSLLSTFPSPPSGRPHARHGPSQSADGRPSAGTPREAGAVRTTTDGSPLPRQAHRSLPPARKGVGSGSPRGNATNEESAGARKGHRATRSEGAAVALTGGAHERGAAGQAPEEGLEAPKPLQADTEVDDDSTADDKDKTTNDEKRKNDVDGDKKADDDAKDNDDEIVMSSTSYPGQEWQPAISAWDD